MRDLKRFGRELHRRSIWQVLGIYAVAAWVGYQIILSLVEGLGLPEWFPAFAIVLFIIGLPIVLATAIIQRGLPGLRGGGRGLESADLTLLPAIDAGEQAAPLARTHHHVFTWRNAILGGVCAFALWGVIAACWLVLGRSAARSGVAARNSIAILPLDNMSRAEEDRFFADGIHEEIITQLAKIGGLNVISRTSVLEYRERKKRLRDIAEELGVNVILEGSVRRAGDRVRITAQLIDASTDNHLWAETYERPLADVFAIQSEVAQSVAQALNVVIGSAERASIEQRPTENLEAYDFYLRGLTYVEPQRAAEPWLIAAEMFTRATQLDPEFALAHAALAYISSRLYHYAFDRTAERLAVAGEAVQRALRLAPDLPEAHLARGYYLYWGFRDYDAALAELAIAARGMPNRPEVHSAVGAIRRRQGRWPEALIELEAATRLDPRSPGRQLDYAQTLRRMRRLQEAAAAYDRVVALAPDLLEARVDQFELALLRGDVPEARRILERLGPETARAPDVINGWFDLLVLERNYAAALKRVADAHVERIEAQEYYRPMPLLSALLHDWAGNAAAARAAYDSARVILERESRAHPEDHRIQSALGLAYAGVGRKADAVRAGQRATELLPLERDDYLGPDFVVALAHIFVIVGDPEAALGELERVGFLLNPHRLEREPRWDPLRNHPRFAALIAASKS